MAGKVEIDQVKLMQEMTLEVKLIRAREMRARLWIAARLIWLACWVTGMGLRIHDQEGPMDQEETTKFTFEQDDDDAN